MNKIGKLLTILLVVIFSGCATNGEHVYFDGKCISCWQNPLTSETLDYDSSGANNFEVLSWHNMMLEGLSRKGVQDLTPFGEDYLKIRLGNKAVSLKNNEIAYQREVQLSAKELRKALDKHRLKPLYQATVASKLGQYDFEKQEFPVMVADSFVLVGGNNLIALPKEITVEVNNVDALPSLKMSPTEAERFLADRRNSRTLYIRYIVEIEDMTSADNFNSAVKEIQFINEKPSVVSRENKEKFQPFQSIRI